MDRLASVKRDMAKVMGFVEFNGGHRYADFIPGTDNVPEYGIAALIAGGLAAKAGLFKVLLGALVALNRRQQTTGGAPARLPFSFVSCSGLRRRVGWLAAEQLAEERRRRDEPQ